VRKILLVKLTSMGDMVLVLPVAHDLAMQFPGVTLDWVADTSFAEIPAMSRHVRRVHALPLRRIEQARRDIASIGKLYGAVQALREERFDALIDLQGLLKSAVVSRVARAAMRYRVIPDYVQRARELLAAPGAREPRTTPAVAPSAAPRLSRSAAFGARLAARVYDREFFPPTHLPAVERYRHVAASALGYAVQGPPVFDIVLPSLSLDRLAAERYGVLLHATSKPEKEWPLPRWVELGRALNASGLHAVLPWGSAAEAERAREIARRLDRATVPGRMPLTQCAALLARAHVVVGVDTGLMHLACALGAPTVALFATDTWHHGPYWSARATTLGGAGRWPETLEVLDAIGNVTAAPRDLVDRPGVPTRVEG